MLLPEHRFAAALAAAGLGIVTVWGSTEASATDLEWTNTSGGLLIFNTTGNWTPSQAPTASDNLLFQIDQGGAPILMNAGAMSLDFTVADNLWVFSGLTSGDLTTSGVALIDDPTATGLLNGAQLQIVDGMDWFISDPLTTTSNDNNLFVGDTGYGSMLISGGSTVEAEQVFTGNQFGGVGEITVTGAGTSLTATRASNTGIHTIGKDGGTGTVNVLDGATLLTTHTGANDIWVGSGFFDADLADPLNPVDQSVGTLNVDGVGSFVETEDLHIGIFGGEGYLNITDGGNVTLTDGNGTSGTSRSPDAFIGNDAGSVGAAVIDGDGSILDARRIDIAVEGSTGTLEVSNGGTAKTTTLSSAFAGNNGDFFIATNDNVSGSTLGGDLPDGRVAVFGTATDGTTASLLEVDANLTVGGEGQGQLFIGRDLDGNEIGSGNLQVDGSVFISSVRQANGLDSADSISANNNLDNRLVVSGANAVANIGTTLTVGSDGNGSFEALNGATVTIGTGLAIGLLSDATGTAVIDGTGTTVTADNLFVGNGSGNGSTGTATVSGGAVATLTGSYDDDAAINAITIGDDDEGVGTLNIQGVGSLVETPNDGWFIGGSGNEQGGTGTVNISDGGVGTAAGRVTLGHGTASNSGSEGNLNVDGAGSRFDANGDFILVGFNGGGNLDITNGGQVNANNIFVADQTGSANSQIDIDGAGSVLDVDTLLIVGDSAAGNLNVTNGGQLNVASDGGNTSSHRLIIGDETTSDGSTVVVDGVGSRIDYLGGERISIGLRGGDTTERSALYVTNGGTLQAVQRDGSNNIITQGWITLGDEANGNGLLEIDGVGSTAEARYLNIGEGTSASGDVNVINGGVLTLTEFAEVGAGGDGDNFLDVIGDGSLLETGGDLSVAAGVSGTRVDGEMRIRDGGAVITGARGFIGRSSDDVGRVDVGGTGALATWDIANELYMSGSTNVSTSSGSQNAGSSTLNVDENGVVTVGGTLYLKDRGTINLNGGELAADDIIFLDFTGTNYDPVPTVNFNSGTLRYTNPTGQSLTSTELGIIFGGGEQILDAGKHLDVAGTTLLGSEIKVDGGTFSFGSMSTTEFAKVEFDSGTLNITGSSLVVTNSGIFGSTLVIDEDETVNVTANAFVQADGLLNVADGNFSSGATVNSGTIVIAQGTADFGSLNNTNGDLVLVDAITTGTITGGDITIVNTNAASALSLTSGSSIGFGIETDAGSADLLEVVGVASLAGSLSVTSADVSSVSLGQEYDLITADSVTGTFDSIALPTLGGGLEFSLLYEAQRVALAVITAGSLEGDYNSDGFVSQGDLDLVLLNWGDSTLPGGFADGNIPGGGPFDGLISQNELDGVLLNWGDGTAPNLSAIPEPGSLAAALLASAGLVLRRRR